VWLAIVAYFAAASTPGDAKIDKQAAPAVSRIIDRLT